MSFTFCPFIDPFLLHFPLLSGSDKYTHYSLDTELISTQYFGLMKYKWKIFDWSLDFLLFLVSKELLITIKYHHSEQSAAGKSIQLYFCYTCLHSSAEKHFFLASINLLVQMQVLEKVFKPLCKTKPVCLERAKWSDVFQNL